jgi:uncharacterized protein (DUF4415 family)
MDLKKCDVEQVAKAIEADAGEFMPGLRQSLEEAKSGALGRIHTPDEIKKRRVGRPSMESKRPMMSMRIDQDILDKLRAKGKGWQTKVNGLLREALLSGKI